MKKNPICPILNGYQSLHKTIFLRVDFDRSLCSFLRRIHVGRGVPIEAVNVGFQISGNPLTDEDIWKQLQKVPDLCLQDVSKPTIITNDIDRMMVCCSKDGSHLIVHVFDHGLVTIDIQHVEQHSSHKSLEKRYSYKMIKNLEASITDILGKSRCQYSRRKQDKSSDEFENCLPTVLKRGKVCPYFLRGNNTLFEYEPSELVFEKNSKWQNIKIYQTETFGHILCLDDDIMIGESDLIYTNTLLGLERGNSFTDRTALILGGGDGGLLHELRKLSPRFIIMVEIDEEVIKACSQHMRGVCGDSLDNMNGSNYTILTENCLKALQDYKSQGVKFDYVINDLSEYLLETETDLAYDYKTSAMIMELSMHLLEPDGKYLSRGNCVTEKETLESFEEDSAAIGLNCQSFIIDVPSFMEKYCLFEVTKPTEDMLNGQKS